MKRLLFSFLVFFVSYCSYSCEKEDNKRKLAIAKQVESVNVYFKAKYVNFNEDSLNLAFLLIDESISIDSNYYLAYQTKTRYLTAEKKYDEALKVNDLVFLSGLEKDNLIAFAHRAALYELLKYDDLANKAYKEAISLYDDRIEKYPDDLNALSIRAMLLFFSEGKDEGIEAYRELLSRSLTDIEIKTIEMTISYLSSTSREEIIENFMK